MSELNLHLAIARLANHTHARVARKETSGSTQESGAFNPLVNSNLSHE
ncbi:MAG: hypothetical protein KGN80_05420 [Acidobacteriota bacterium]|nr:hypothetical protein [Acidobacteriota bacterium]